MEPPSHLFVRERARLLVLFPRSLPFQTKKLGEIWRKMPNLQNRIPHQRAERLFFSGLGQCTKAGAMEPQSHLFVRERARLLVLFPIPLPFPMPCDTTPVGSVGACDVICNDVVM